MKKLVLSSALAATAIAWVALAQTAPGGQMKSLSHAIHAVEDLDTTLAFYKDVFEISGNPQDFANAAVPQLTNAPGVTLRLAMVTLAGGTRFELTHFKGLERKGAQAKYTDPGAGSLVFYVRDIKTAVEAAKKAKATFVTTGGTPIEITTAKGKAKSIVMRDPDGFFLQLVEEAPAADAPAGNLLHVSLAYTMESADATKNFYTGIMGVALSGSTTYRKDPAFAKLVGAPKNIEFRKLTGTMPGQNPGAAGTLIEFTEFKGVPRTRFVMRVRDPGAPALCIQVNNIETAVAQMKAAGVPLISKDGQIVDFGGGTHNIFVQDPNGMNLELFERSGNAQPKGKLGPATK